MSCKQKKSEREREKGKTINKNFHRKILQMRRQQQSKFNYFQYDRRAE